MTDKQIRESLMEQLKAQNNLTDYNESLVNDYIRYWNIKEMMVSDIQENGLRLTIVNGNGFEVVKPNESVQNLPKITATMLKILNDLKLKDPLLATSAEDDYL